MSDRIWYTKKNIRSIYLTKEHPSKSFEYKPEQMVYHFWGLIKGKLKKECWSTGNSSWDDSHTRENLPEKFLIKDDNSLWYKPEVCIYYQNNGNHTLYFDTDAEALEWVNSFIDKNNMKDMLVEIK